MARGRFSASSPRVHFGVTWALPSLLLTYVILFLGFVVFVFGSLDFCRGLPKVPCFFVATMPRVVKKKGDFFQTHCQVLWQALKISALSQDSRLALGFLGPPAIGALLSPFLVGTVLLK